jgi:hypothetical protein
MLNSAQSLLLLHADARNRDVIWPFLTGNELISRSAPKRSVIDFQTRSILEAREYDAPFDHVERHVLPYITNKAAAERRKTGEETGQEQTWLKTWWQFFRQRPALIEKITRLPRYIVCSRVTKRPIFEFISPAIRPGDALSCFALADDYSFGILQSHAHWLWFITKCSKLTARPRYTPESVFDTFPWPQEASAKQVTDIAKAGREVRRVRSEAMAKVSGGLRGVYRTLELPGSNPLKDANGALDAAVLSAYGFSAKRDLLGQLLKLNVDVAARITAGQQVISPGIPPSYPRRDTLVTDDCIRPAN